MIKTGSFAEDSRGRWYLNLTARVADEAEMLPLAPNCDVGIGPGTKTVLTTSDGEKFERENLTRDYEERLARHSGTGKKHTLTKSVALPSSHAISITYMQNGK